MELTWGPYTFAETAEAGTEHFLVVGATGSGKTTLIRRLMCDVFGNGGREEPPPPSRALVYDPKLEVISFLSRFPMNHNARLKTLHPFDRRGHAWDLAKDIRGILEARQIATNLIPSHRESGSNQFFVDAARDLLAGVMLTFAKCLPDPDAWTFRDVLLAMLHQPYLEWVLSHDTDRDGKPFIQNERLKSSYLGSDPKRTDWRTVSNIRSTINARLSVYEPVAAAWFEAWEAGRRFSVREWKDSTDTIVLGNDEAARVPIDAINRALFKRIVELVLAKEEMPVEARRAGNGFSWFFLDEVREAGELDGLSRLMTKGRSKGVCVVLGFQDIEGMRSAYGKEIANEIAGQCGHAAFLRVSSETTAEWASKSFGEGRARTESETRGTQGFSQGESQAVRRALFTTELLFLPQAGPGVGIPGAFKSIRGNIQTSGSGLMNWPQLMFPPTPEAGGEGRLSSANIEPLDTDDLILEPWTEADWVRLGLSGEPPSYRRQPEAGADREDPATSPEDIRRGIDELRGREEG